MIRQNASAAMSDRVLSIFSERCRHGALAVNLHESIRPDKCGEEGLNHVGESDQHAAAEYGLCEGD